VKISKMPFIIVNGIIIPIFFIIMLVTSQLNIVETSIIITLGFLLVETSAFALMVAFIYEWKTLKH
jgi:hypothetical protein